MKMESLQQRREELERKEYQLKESLLKFDKFLKVNKQNCSFPGNFIKCLQFYLRNLLYSYRLKIFQENDSKRARAVKKANDERDLKKTKDKEIERLFSSYLFSRSLYETSVSQLKIDAGNFTIINYFACTIQIKRRNGSFS